MGGGAGGAVVRMGGRPAAQKVGGRRCMKRARRVARPMHSPTAVTAAEYAFGSPMSLDPASLGFDVKAVEEEAKRPSYDKQHRRKARYSKTGAAGAKMGRSNSNVAVRRRGMLQQPGGASCAQRREA